MIKPYYQDSSVTIYHANTLDILQHIEGVDAVLTDPPYGVGSTSVSSLRKNRKSKSQYLSYIDNEFNHENLVVPIISNCISLFLRVVLTPGIKNMMKFPDPDHIGSFQYGAGTTVMSCWGPVLWQPIFYYGKDPHQGKLVPDSFQNVNDHAEENGHPCPKPIKSWKKLLMRMSNEGETIFDPLWVQEQHFRICKDSGRKAIGIEIEERYCEIAVKMMRQEVLL